MIMPWSISSIGIQLEKLDLREYRTNATKLSTTSPSLSPNQDTNSLRLRFGRSSSQIMVFGSHSAQFAIVDREKY